VKGDMKKKGKNRQNRPLGEGGGGLGGDSRARWGDKAGLS